MTCTCCTARCDFQDSFLIKSPSLIRTRASRVRMNGGGRIQLNRRRKSNFQSHSQHPFSFAPAPLRWPRHPPTVPERAQTDIPSATKALRRSLHPAAHQNPHALAPGRSPIHCFSLRSFRLSYRRPSSKLFSPPGGHTSPMPETGRCFHLRHSARRREFSSSAEAAAGSVR
jgi:hypothetical protein